MTTHRIGAAYVVAGLFCAGISCIADATGFGREVMRVFVGTMGLGLILGGLCLLRDCGSVRGTDS